MFNLLKAELKKVNPSGGAGKKATNQKNKNLFSVNLTIDVLIDDMHHQKIKRVWSLKSLLFSFESLALQGGDAVILKQAL